MKRQQQPRGRPNAKLTNRLVGSALRNSLWHGSLQPDPRYARTSLDVVGGRRSGAPGLPERNRTDPRSCRCRPLCPRQDGAIGGREKAAPRCPLAAQTSDHSSFLDADVPVVVVQDGTIFAKVDGRPAPTDRYSILPHWGIRQSVARGPRGDGKIGRVVSSRGSQSGGLRTLPTRFKSREEHHAGDVEYEGRAAAGADRLGLSQAAVVPTVLVQMLFGSRLVRRRNYSITLLTQPSRVRAHLCL